MDSNPYLNCKILPCILNKNNLCQNSQEVTFCNKTKSLAEHLQRKKKVLASKWTTQQVGARSKVTLEEAIINSSQ